MCGQYSTPDHYPFFTGTEVLQQVTEDRNRGFSGFRVALVLKLRSPRSRGTETIFVMPTHDLHSNFFDVGVSS